MSKEERVKEGREREVYQRNFPWLQVVSVVDFWLGASQCLKSRRS